MISTASVAGVGYYTGSGDGARDEHAAPGSTYYTGASEKGEPPGQWSGRLAEQLGLAGDVDAATMERLFEKFEAPDGSRVGRPPMQFRSIESRIEQALALEPDALPERIEQIKAEVARSTRSSMAGMDLTFSVPKSVTVAHTAAWRVELDATRSGDADRAAEFRSIREGIEGAIVEANGAAMEYASTLSTSRRGSSTAGTIHWVAAPDLAVASFFQHTSRADDPQLHVHNVVLNRARNDDGQIRALDTVDLRDQRHAYSAVADRVLAERLADTGIAMEIRPDGVSREVVGVDDDVMALFSQRRQAIAKAMQPAVERAEQRLGRELNALERSRLAQTINLVTRESKSGISDPDQLLDLWEDRIVAELGSGLRPTAERLPLVVQQGSAVRDARFSSSAVAAEATVAAAQTRAAWSRADLMLEVERRLPLLGLSTEKTVELVSRVTDHALAADGVRQVAGHVRVLPPTDLVAGSYVRPSSVLYAAPVTLEAEDLIRRAAIERGREHLDGAAVGAWLDEHYPSIGADQRAAVVGVASSDAALTQLIGPAGTGKSYAAGALTGAWQQLAGGPVHGLAVSQNAAEILREDGVPDSANVTAWLASHDRLEAGRPLDVDESRAVGPRDVVLVDEASMVGTTQLDRVRSIVDSIGARLVLMGDPRQLGAVGAGGAMGLVEGRAETYTLSDVRRFAEDWEADASLRLRDGDREALVDYDRHGRLVETASMDDAIARAARAAAADRIAGLSVVASTDTNDEAARLADAVREHLVAAGLVEADGVPLGRTGSLAGIGDEVMTRQNDYDLGVLNRQRFHVVGTGTGTDTGGQASLSVLGDDGVVRELPADYVDKHVHLAYGSTVHAAQGATVDRGYVLTDGRSDAAALYVGLTRGRDRNTAYVALTASDPDALEAAADGTPRPTARSVLEDCLERETASRAALVEAEADAVRAASMKTLLGQLEDGTQRAVRARMDGDLDQLVADGLLPADDRVRLGADQSSEHLSQLLRAAEQAGHDPQQILRDAVAQRSLADADSVAQVLSHRISSSHDIETAAPHRVVPARLPAAHAEYLVALQALADDRARELGSDVAEQQPAWAVKALGAVPANAIERLEWEARAGQVAAYREAAGFDDAARALPSAPGLTSTEKRATWWTAWEALGRPSEQRAEAVLSDGQLHARVTAWQREQQWAPAHADAALRDAELRSADARTEAIIAEADGESERAIQLRADADHLDAVARGTSAVADSRSAWAAGTAVTRELAERAERELDGRGLTPGAESDRVDAAEWLTERQRSIEAEDEHRPVTELDVAVHEEEAAPPTWPVLDDETELRQPSPAHDVAPVEPDDLELAALTYTASEAEERIADRESEEAAHEALDAELEAAPEHGSDLGDACAPPVRRLLRPRVCPFSPRGPSSWGGWGDARGRSPAAAGSPSGTTERMRAGTCPGTV